MEFKNKFVNSYIANRRIVANIRQLNEIMINISRVSPTDPEVQDLIERLNHYQIGLYGREKCNLESADSLLKNDAFMLGAFLGDKLIGIGAIKKFDSYAEIKRMYVTETHRRKGIAEMILSGLEAYAIKNTINRICLETGNMHKPALAFYKRKGYHVIKQFGNYFPNEVSVYFEKILKNVLIGLDK